MTTLIATLLSNAVTVTVLALVVFAVSRKIQNQRLAHALWVILLLKLITPTFIALPFVITVDDSWLTIDANVFFSNSAIDIADKGSPVSSTAPLTETELRVASVAGAQRTGVAAEQDVPKTRSGVTSGLLSRWSESWPRVVVSMLLMLWLVGSGVYVIRLLVRYVRFCRFLRKNEIIEEELISEGYDLAYKMGLKRPPRVRVLSGAFSPMLCGLGRGVTLILPLDLLHRLTPEGRATLVVHELSHYARGDYLVRVLETIVMAIFWWHPVVWWIRRELEIVEEDCCDSRVLAEFPGQPRHYAEAILDAIDFLSERPVVMPPIASGLGTTPLLKRRLTRIMTETSVDESPRWDVRPVIACAVVLIPLQMVQFRSEQIPVARQTIDAAQDLADVNVQHPQLSEEETASIASSRAWSTVKSPDGRWSVLVDHEQQCRLFSSIERRCVELPTSIASTVVFSPDSQRLAIGTTDGRLLVLRSPDWTVEFNVGRGSAIRSVDWSPSGDRIALCTEAGDLKLLSSDDMSAISLRRLPMTCLNCVRFSADAGHLIVGCGDWKTDVDSALLILDAKSLSLASVWNSEAPIAFVRLGDHSDEITVCDWSGRINLLSLTDLRLLNSQWIPKDLVPPLAFSFQSDDAGVITGAF